MLKNRSIQVKLVDDKGQPGTPRQTTSIDPDQIIESVVMGVCVIVCVYKGASLISNSVEHVVTTKVK